MKNYLLHRSYILYVTENLSIFRCRSSGCDPHQMAVRGTRQRAPLFAQGPHNSHLQQRV